MIFVQCMFAPSSHLELLLLAEVSQEGDEVRGPGLEAGHVQGGQLRAARRLQLAVETSNLLAGARVQSLNL